MSATIQDVAQAAEVSPATVSLVLHQKGALREETRRRVRSTIERLNYEPRRRTRTRGRSVVGASGGVALVCPDSPGSSHPRAESRLYRQWLLGARRGFEQSGRGITVSSGSSRFEDDPFLAEALAGDDLDGVVLIGLREGDGYLDAVRDAGVPAVVLNRRPDAERFSYVGVDNYGAGRKAARRLIQLEHRRLAVLTSAQGERLGKDRAAGLMDGAGEAGLPSPLTLYARFDDDDAVFDRLLARLRRGRRTGVFAFNDTMAVRLLAACERHGVAVPREMAVIGFDDAEVTSPGGLRPTSMAIDTLAMGHAAAAMLVRLIDATPRRAFLAETFEADIVEHDTTA